MNDYARAPQYATSALSKNEKKKKEIDMENLPGFGDIKNTDA